MYLDILTDNEVTPIEFSIEKIAEIERGNRWLLTGRLDDKILYLKFTEYSFLLKEVEERPANLVTEEDVLTEIINDLLREEHEKRQEGFDESDESSDEELQPYDPNKISIRNERWSLSHVFEMIDKYQYIDLNPDFQRNFVWDTVRRSQLIESLMLRIPIPAFYLSETKEGKFQVVDGLQRLTTIKEFMKNEFRLKGLEYLTEQEGRYFESDDGKKKGIEGGFVMTINLTQINVNIIESKSPAKVKYDVFRRVNTGGKPLNNQEIRNCLADNSTRTLINSLAYSEEFKRATGGSVKTTRMQAQELCLRFIGFFLYVIEKREEWIYRGNMTEYLDDKIELLNKTAEDDAALLQDRFNNAMKNAEYLFGEYAFRKCLLKDLEKGARRQLINKSLFTAWSVMLSPYPHEYVKSKAEAGSFAKLLAQRLEENKEYLSSVSYKTNDKIYVNKSFQETFNIIKEKLGSIHAANNN